MKKFASFLVIASVSLMLAACGGSNSSSSNNTNAGNGGSTTTDGERPDDAIEIIPDSNEEDADYTWNSTDEVLIELNSTSITVTGAGATVDGTIVTINAAGTYRITGPLSDGQVVVDTNDTEVVRLIFDGINIANSTSAAINIQNAERSVIFLEEGTANFLSDAIDYVFDNPDDDEPNAALFSDDDLAIFGTGSLTVTANYNDGITSKDGLIIISGDISITAEDDGIRGKDYLIIRDGNFTINAQGDGLKSDNDEDAELGYISIDDGVFDITATGDAMQAETNLQIASGDFTLESGGGSSLVAANSAKALKAVVNTIIDGGTFTIDAADDGIHSNDSITINGGTFDITTSDDGVHADTNLVINDGTINVTESYEGIESSVMRIAGGNILVFSDDDGINVAGGADGSGGGGFNNPGNNFLYIDGGYIVVHSAVDNSNGDGLDANGSIEMTGGTVLVHGPSSGFDSAIDFDGSFAITGGLLVGAGSASRLAGAPGTASTQNSVEVTLNSSQPANQVFHIQSDAGVELLTFAPAVNYESVVFSSPNLLTGTTYNIYTGGSSTGTQADGLYSDGDYTPGSLFSSFTVASVITEVD